MELPFLSYSATAGVSQRPAATSPEPSPPVISVGELDRRLKRLVEGGTAEVRVEGEVSGLKEVASGHAYFSLKDEHEDASIDCVMYRTAPARARRLLSEGARVVLEGRASVYAPRGRLQFIASGARPAGRGALLEALERLKQRLAEEGLFAPDRKRKLPAEPHVIGIVTSGDGAAIHDIAKVAFRRAPVRLLLARAAVQGASAPAQLARAIALLGQVPEVDAIILGRGGGSSDDLAAFNDETLVRAVVASRVPVVSAVGHEIDTTLTDLAADARAATPSQAAELLVPDAVSRAESVTHLKARMRRAMTQRIREERAIVERFRASLGNGERIVAERRQRIDEASLRLATLARQPILAQRVAIGRFERRLSALHPRTIIASGRAELGPLEVRLSAAISAKLAACRRDLGAASAELSALSPLSVLARGYAIATGPSGRAILDAAEVQPGHSVRIRVHQGSFSAVVAAPPPGTGTEPHPAAGPACSGSEHQVSQGDSSGKHRDA